MVRQNGASVVFFIVRVLHDLNAICVGGNASGSTGRRTASRLARVLLNGSLTERTDRDRTAFDFTRVEVVLFLVVDRYGFA